MIRKEKIDGLTYAFCPKEHQVIVEVGFPFQRNLMSCYKCKKAYILEGSPRDFSIKNDKYVSISIA